jgi:hypothetical protein
MFQSPGASEKAGGSSYIVSQNGHVRPGEPQDRQQGQVQRVEKVPSQALPQGFTVLIGERGEVRQHELHWVVLINLLVL